MVGLRHLILKVRDKLEEIAKSALNNNSFGFWVSSSWCHLTSEKRNLFDCLFSTSNVEAIRLFITVYYSIHNVCMSTAVFPQTPTEYFDACTVLLRFTGWSFGWMVEVVLSRWMFCLIIYTASGRRKIKKARLTQGVKLTWPTSTGVAMARERTQMTAMTICACPRVHRYLARSGNKMATLLHKLTTSLGWIQMRNNLMRNCNETPFFMPAQKTSIAYSRYLPFTQFQCRNICFNQSEYFSKKIIIRIYCFKVQWISYKDNHSYSKKQNEKCLLKKALNICRIDIIFD